MTLYDAYGRPVDTAQLREEQAGPTLAGVRNIYSVMHPSVGLTPEKLAAILRQAEFGDPFLYLELAEEMEEKDLHYLAVLETRKQTVAQLDLVSAACVVRQRRRSRRRDGAGYPFRRHTSGSKTRFSTFSMRSAKASRQLRSSGILPATSGSRSG